MENWQKLVKSLDAIEKCAIETAVIMRRKWSKDQKTTAQIYSVEKLRDSLIELFPLKTTQEAENSTKGKG